MARTRCPICDAQLEVQQMVIVTYDMTEKGELANARQKPANDLLIVACSKDARHYYMQIPGGQETLKTYLNRSK
ncbi:MAG: hypothetical protein EOM59_14390 [Clostridia bacterium]|jgi:hypothetical protein|nr:hypothetical protein [Clostridia bacterium]